MKVLQINSLKNSGSTGRIAEGIGLKVIEQGGVSYIAYARSSNPGNSIPVKIGGRRDQLLHLAMTRIFDDHGFHSDHATRNLVWQIEDLAPDIIHLHNLHGYYLNVKILFEFLKDYNKPVVWTIHDCWPFTGHCCYYERINCRKWKTECSKCELKWLYPQSYLFDNSRKNFRRKKFLFNLPEKMSLIAVSNWLESQVRESFLKKFPVSTIYNGVDLSIFKPTNGETLKKKYGLTGKKIILGLANVWSDGKGLQSFIELSRRVDRDYHIILIGLRGGQIKKLPGNISGYERTASADELAEYYNLADVFVNPSIAETFGIVTAEALGCGTPVVAYNTSSMPELVNEDVGFIVPLIDYDMLHRKVRDVISSGKSYYMENCRKRAEELFDMNVQFEKYLELYRSLIRTNIISS